MTRGILIALLLLLVNLPARAQHPEPTKSFVADEKVHDFGTIMEIDGKVKHTFRFRNDFAEPRTIGSITAFCGCTEVEYAETPVAPGRTAEVTVTFDPNHRPGFFSKEVVVILSPDRSGQSHYTRIWVKGDVVPYLHPVEEDHPYDLGEGFHTSHIIVAYPPYRKGEWYDFDLRVANDTEEPMQVELHRSKNIRGLEMPDTLQLAPLERRVITLRYIAPQTYYRFREISVTPKVNGVATTPIRITWLGHDL